MKNFLKRFAILFAISIGVFFNSCISELVDENKTSGESVLFKTWYLYAGFQAGTAYYHEFTINPDGTYKYYDRFFGGRVFNGTYKIIDCTTKFDDRDDVKGQEMYMNFKVKTKFIIEFDIDYEIKKIKILYGEQADNKNNKIIYFETPIIGTQHKGYYDDHKRQ
jgi:hypothetical protein